MLKKSFGEITAQKFKVGELISFSQIAWSDNPKQPFEKFQGIIIEFYEENKTGRSVCMAKILPVNSTIPIEIPCITIKKIGTI